MKTLPGNLLMVGLLIFSTGKMMAQAPAAKQHIVVDIGHAQKFWNDPSDMAGADPDFVERVQYMKGELEKNATSLNADVSFQKSAITPDALAKCDLLFIHMPSAKFSEGEVDAIKNYIQKGGAMFLVMEVDYWSTLAQANVNDIVNPFGIVFKADNPDGQSTGGYTKPGKVASKRFSIPYHGARMVEGGIPFCYSNKTEENPFGVYKEVKGGGKIIAMGEGMVSLYMTSWEGVNNYQCSEFMHDALAWLLK